MVPSLSQAAVRIVHTMKRIDHQRVVETAKWSSLALAGTSLLTFCALRLHLNFISASFCYLLLVVLISLSGDLTSSAITSIAGAGCLTYFFVEPIYSFRVNDPIDLLALFSFLVTGLVIARLVTRVRAKAAASQLDHENLKQLYELAQKLLALEPDVAPDLEFLGLFVGVFGICGACLFDAVSGELQFSGRVSALLEERTGAAFARGKDIKDQQNQIYARPIRIGGRAIGAIGFEGLREPQLAAGALGALGAAHLERTRSFRDASRAAAAAHAESYRSAILDALAHEFKTPLSTILTAAGALREADTLGSHHREMAETVESEASRLSRLTNRLLRTARLEQSEVRPWMELTDLSSLLSNTITSYRKNSPGRVISVVKECNSSDVLADPELIQLAVSQLLDNACKYSTPGSQVTLRVSNQRGFVALRVLSNGSVIQPGEKEQIFDRFYRGVSGHRMAPGSGLGLFVARKIALAHGGTLDLDHDDATAEGTAFCLMLPMPEKKSSRGRNDIHTSV
jgi:two-component system sensor histidine kinase KdpD